MSEQPKNPTAAKKGGAGAFLVVVLVLLVGAASAGAALWWARRAAPAAAGRFDPAASERGLVAFEPFVVNLADPNASRFLRATIHVIVPSADAAERIQKTPVALMQARSSILELLTVQTSDALVTPQGKATLKKAIADRVGPALGDVKVLDVLFSDFVIQF